MKRTLRLSVMLAALSSGCTASIGADSPGGSAPGAAGAGSPGTPGSAGSGPVGGGSATAGAGSGSGGAAAGAVATRVLRRLNKSEYNNTVRDLLGTSLRPSDKLPDEASVEGFDTNGEALTMAVVHVKTFEQAATQLVDELYGLPETDERRRKVLLCKPAAGMEAGCAEQIFSSFTRRAFRRPVQKAEIERLLAFVEKVRASGESYDGAIRAALISILISPHFLYMVERGELAPGVAKPLDDHELATRLSYFLWSSMPDESLFAAADAGGLTSDAAKLMAEVRRMLTDPKAAALAHDFVGQWLTLRRLELVEPSKAAFPTYDVSLRDAAVRETELFIQALVNDNAPVDSLLSSNFTFANQRLAQHYGVAASGADFARVDLSGTERVGILGQTSFLMANSHPGWTSPTKRGAWVLEQLLCSPPPPVPADLNVEPLDEPPPNQTKREQLEEHRKEPKCAGCHAVMDPIGLGLENFDAIGAYRATDNGRPVDASGVLDGKSFVGLRQLADLLKTDTRLQKCYARQLLTYAVGRSFHDPSSESYADELAQAAGAGGSARMRDVIEAVIQSDAFRARRGQ